MNHHRHCNGWTSAILAYLVCNTAPAFAELPDVPEIRNQRQHFRLSWGHKSGVPQPFQLRFQASHCTLHGLQAESFEGADRHADTGVVSRAGGGDVDAVLLDLEWSTPTQPPREVQSIWQYLLEHGDSSQAERLQDDPGRQPDAPLLTVLLNPAGTEGFSVGLEQVLRHGRLWLPEHDLLITTEPVSPSLDEHLSSLQGQRVLTRVKSEPEATLAAWTRRWEDVGNPYQWEKPWETLWMGTRGHLVGIAAWHGALHKFGIDRWANVRPDHASPHRFRLDFLWPGCRWHNQRLVEGLPVILTELARDEQRCRIEQFAAMLDLAPLGQTPEPTSVFFTQLQLTGTGPTSVGFGIDTESTNRHPEWREINGRHFVVDRETDHVWLAIEPGPGLKLTRRENPGAGEHTQIVFDCEGEASHDEVRTVVLKLFSPAMPSTAAARLAAFGFDQARADTVGYWEDWLSRGARFEVPEVAVNDLFRANLWHALILPRHRLDEQGERRMDLPYSNFAYGQLNADWPINQAVYVDYMLYGLRGYFDVAEAEFASMYRTQQKPNGRVGGYAEWGVYSPGMLYSIACNYLLSHDRLSFERLLPASLRALDWCLEEIARGQATSSAPGLIVAPLNDLTQEARAWAFPNAYFVAGLHHFGEALALHGHPRADAVGNAAAKMAAAVERAFARASVQSPVVQLADGTWINYVPCDALTPRRLLEQWYPTDVDTGALHLSRLRVLDPHGWLTTALLNDHEDNLFLNQWGMANEPVYNQQATVYLLRDEPEAAIRAFYSMMACAFSHHQLSPLEHRWAWGQYFGPPSTDGAWFDLYRNLLVNELRGENTLFIGQATPRAWLRDGQVITVERAPTHFGPIHLRIESATAAATATITADLQLPGDRPLPKKLLLRLRHPEKALLKSVTANGSAWLDFDPAMEWIQIMEPTERRYRVVAHY